MASANKELLGQGLCVGRRSGMVGGSALILVVVLTSLLAIVGVMFVMVSRIDRMATSGISEDKQLDLAVDTVVGKISGQLVWDVPGTTLPSGGRPEYHDYPGPEDRWLAASEPNKVGTTYTWPQISDVTGILASSGRRTRNVVIAKVTDDSRIILEVDGLPDQLADADGDGVGDSKWFVIDGITSSKGERIYAGVRATDNGGKMNINVAFKFDPDNPAIVDPFNPYDPNISGIDGTSPLQINLLALAARPGAFRLPADIAADEMALLLTRANYGVNVYPYRLDLYEDNVIWRYGELAIPYTPFDISDELELRNRFLLDQRDIDARIERLGWTGSFINNYTLEVPIGQGGSGSTLDDWFARANESVGRTVSDPNKNPYDYRHLATSYSMDRIINPVGLSLNNGKMANINTINVFDPPERSLMGVIKTAILDANPTMLPIDVEKLAGQLAANIKDFRDADSDVTVVWDTSPSGSGTRYYGYERPCIYISEVTGIVTTDGTTNYKSFAVELHKPYFEDDAPKDRPGPLDSGWQLKIEGVAEVVPIDWSGIGRYHVVLFQQDPNGLGPLVDFNDSEELLYEAAVPGYPRELSPRAQDANFVSLEGKTIYLQRFVGFPVAGFIMVDCVPFSVPSAGAAGGWLSPDGTPRNFRRDISQHKCIRRLWDGTASTAVTLGRANGYVDSDSAIVQAHPYLDPNVYTSGFKNVGEIGMVFDVNAYNVPVGSKEADLRLDLQKNQYARLLNYLTVVDPTSDGRDSDGDGTREDLGLTDLDEKKVPGRININTAPPFVLEQLPWIAPPPARDPAIAIAVAAYRDDVLKGFGSISELLWVPEMAFYRDVAVGDQDGFPDLTPLSLLGARDGVADDIEERDLVFHRISNLVTVRSDVFTAYILVRIGTDGPQRRVVAILDRSDVEPNNANTKVKVRALHKMADAW